MTCNLKRMLALLMTLVLVLTICPVDCFAAGEDQVDVGCGQMQNPLLPELPQDLPLEKMRISSGALQTADIALGDGAYVTEQEAAVLMRDAMVARETTFTINILTTDGALNVENELFHQAYAFDLAEGAYDGDYLRWSWQGIKWDYTGSGLNYSYTFYVTYYTDAQQEQLLQSAVEEALENMNLADQTDYRKISAIYDYICTQANYDHDALARTKANTGTLEDYLIFTAYGAMLRGKAVCQGYACLLYAMCREAGIPVRIIHNSTHAWNIVKLGDLWYNMDVTWDGQDDENRANYFLKGSSAFAGHTPDEEFTTDSFQQTNPMAVTDYVASAQGGCSQHSFDEGVLTVPACEGTGTRMYTCGNCGFTKEESVPMTGHHHVKKTKPAGCTEPGSIYMECIYCGDSYEEETIAATGHKYEQTVVKSTCTAGGYRANTCLRCGDYYVDQETEALGHSWDEGQVTTAATETAPGEITYTCTTCRGTKTAPIPPTEHSYDEGTVTVEPSCLNVGKKTYTCSGCGGTYPVDIPALGHSWDSGQVTTAPTEGQEGERTYTCTVCGDTKKEPIALITHHFDAGTVLREATCSKTGKIEYACTDEDCDYSYEDDIPINELGHHHEKKTVEPTCTQDGAVMAVCIYCGDSFEEEQIPALGHKDQTTIHKPTCTEAGETVITCERCGRVEKRTQSATGHSYIKSVVAPTEAYRGYTSHTCRYCGESYADNYTEKLTHEYRETVVLPTCTEKGYTIYTCIHCQDSYRSDFKSPTGHKYCMEITRLATGANTGEKTYTCQNCGQEKKETLPRLNNPFRDVAAGTYYYEPILWAANQGIAKGMTDVTFEPALECNRAQVVTFLWRAAGEPKATKRSCPFTDVEEGSYYYEAVLWAVEQNITKGMSQTTFGPNIECTRAHVVTFLWRAAGQPGATKGTCSFTDVIKGEFYYDAMLWAVEKNITNGMGNNCFEPNTICTRGQVVTFLYRSR